MVPRWLVAEFHLHRHVLCWGDHSALLPMSPEERRSSVEIPRLLPAQFYSGQNNRIFERMHGRDPFAITNPDGMGASNASKAKDCRLGNLWRGLIVRSTSSLK